MENHQYFDLTTKNGLRAYLGTLPPQLIVDFLAQGDRDRLLQELAAFGHQFQSNGTGSSTLANNDNTLVDEVPETPTVETKSLRPLNAFMGFRSWYSKILPDAQQKDVSFFITRLWEKDVRRNDWSLIAKLYSSIRDTVGKGNVTLKAFLSHACPVMQIVAPENYLDTFKWSVMVNQDGQRVLHQDEDALKAVVFNMSHECPSTEIELLQAVLNTGFLPKHAQILVEKLAGNAKGLMTTSGGKMQELVQSLIADPTGTAAQILGSSAPVTVNTAEVEEFSLLDEALVLNEGEFTHYPAFVNVGNLKDNVAAGDDKGGAETHINIGDGSSDHTDKSNTPQSLASGPSFESNTAISPDYEDTSFQSGVETSVGAISHPNFFESSLFQADDDSNYMLSFNQQPLNMGAMQHFPINFDHGNGFPQYF